jgi:hypothetical protein
VPPKANKAWTMRRGYAAPSGSQRPAQPPPKMNQDQAHHTRRYKARLLVGAVIDPTRKR